MKITQTGDDALHRLFDGTRFLKCDEHLECYGSIDELNSYIGLIRDFSKPNKQYQGQPLTVQNKLVCSLLHFSTKRKIIRKFALKKRYFNLEHGLTKFQQELPPAEGFILPLETTSHQCAI